MWQRILRHTSIGYYKTRKFLYGRSYVNTMNFKGNYDKMVVWIDELSHSQSCCAKRKKEYCFVELEGIEANIR